MNRRPDDPNKPSRAMRLLGAVEGVRASRDLTTSITRPAPPKPATVTTGDNRKTPLRAISFPKASNALRLHVTAMKDRAVTPTTTRIRERTVSPPPAASEAVKGPSPRLRLRAAEAGQTATVETRLTVGRGPAQAARELGAMGPEIGSPGAVGQLVRERRERLGFTQLELATRAGTGRRFISELESGKPTLELGRTLAVLDAVGIRILAEVPDDG